MTRAIWWMMDVLFIPSLIVWLAFEPNFRAGMLLYLEAGLYLGPIQGIFHGEVPYRDSITLLGPLFLYLPAGLMAIFSQTVTVLRAYFHTAAILNLLIAYGVGRWVCRTRTARYLLPLILLIETYDPFWSSRWGGLRAGLGLLVVGCLIQYVRHGRPRILAAAGVLTSVSLLYSTDVGIFSLGMSGIAVALLVVGRLAPTGRPRRDGLIYLATVAVVLLPWLGFCAVTGALGPYLQTAFWILPRQLAAVWGQGIIPSLWEAAATAPSWLAFLGSDTVKIYLPSLLYTAAIAYLLTKARRRAITRETVGIGLLICYGLIQYLSAFRAILGPQFQTALIPTVLLTTVAIERSMGHSMKTVRLAGAVALIITTVYFVGSEKRYYGSLAGWVAYQRHKAALIPNSPQPVKALWDGWTTASCERVQGLRLLQIQADEIDTVVQFLHTHTAPEEPIFTFPEHGIFHFLADRPGISRFDIAGLAATTPAWERELLEALRHRPPRYVIRGLGLSILARSTGRPEELLPEVRAYLEARYRVVQRFWSVEILERVGSG